MAVEISTERELLSQALNIFFRYGYRKTSLDEVARAASLSRQTIYQRYKSKKNLFTSAVINLLDSSIKGVEDILNEKNLAIEEQLLKAFDLWGGYYVKTLKGSPHVDEIISATNEYVGGIISLKQNEFIKVISKAFKKNRVSASYMKHGIPPLKLAEMLYFTHKGIAYLCDGYGSFLEEMRWAIKIVCKD